MSHSPPMFDIIVFGATSFVGQIISRYLVDQYGVDGSVKWAIAGRSESKLAALRVAMGDSARNLPLIVADAQSADSLTRLCTQTTVVMSTVGPYALYGEPLVKACVETGTDYCDLTGEAHWIKRMIDRYERLARQTGARIVHCCGYDSIPSDMGVYFLQQQAQERFGQYCSSVHMRVKSAKGGASGGTIASVLNLVNEASTDSALRRELANPYSICPAVDYVRPKQKPIMSVAYDDDAKAWIAPFVMAAINERVVQRSNALLHYHKYFMYNEAMLTGKGPLGYFGSVAITAGIGGFMLAAAVSPLQRIIKRFLPKPGDGPGPEAQQNGYFVHDVYGHTDSGETLKIRVSGDRDPGYGSTAKMISEAGVLLAQGTSKADKAGGFYTPAAIFGAKLIQRLQNFSGMKFEVIESN
ncbi:saccharopine dehydrogenase family protein [Spirosoma pollinicola]|uniref:Saccharopine dehydrogenase n=1 Tax=Spirosoma pollinicola TaxID=2057025 RepID=A0A2K8Z1Z2_9BACT|nr:saccharopine dehydrogenase NADP-binding domain-containing protein [Spirosoma pollinicola]AUD03844.1 saccharopine dehydrogenase [Spirosoma pollinicola]